MCEENDHNYSVPQFVEKNIFGDFVVRRIVCTKCGDIKKLSKTKREEATGA